MARGPDLGGPKRLRPKLGRTQREPRAKLFVARVLAAKQLAGAAGSRRGRLPGAGRGGGAAWIAHRTLLADRSRRVIVKTRIVRHRPRMTPLGAHLSYLRREGVTRDGSDARMFDEASDEADAGRFAERCAGDRRHFRFVVSPEDAGELTDLHGYTRDLVREMERDLGTRLDWIAVDHWNTDNPHVHLVVRGVADDGSALVIHRDYVSRGMRARAIELATIELGPRSEWEIRSKLAGEIDAERWTGLDRAIQRAATQSPGGVVDLRPDVAGAADDPRMRSLVVGRLQRLERMGLARQVGPAQWLLAEEAEPTLRELGLRGDIIKTLHRALGRAAADAIIHDRTPDRVVVGRVAAKGLYDELAGNPYLVIEGVDGRSHYVRPAAAVDLGEIPEGGVVRVAPDGTDRRGGPWVRVLSALPIEGQIDTAGATWLDRELVGRAPAELAPTGFGAAVAAARDQRAEVLIEQGLASRRGRQLVFARDLLATLEAREVEAAATRIAAESGRTYERPRDGEVVQGVYRRRVDLVSDRYALIETADDAFSLVPWRREIAGELGREVSGVVKGRAIDWTIGRDRGLEIS
jgi:type IV secretory pathway VirD2 relaxase